MVCIIVSCGKSSREEKKAEHLVKSFLDSLNHNSNNYQIIGYKDFHPIYTTAEDDPNYEKYKQNSSKLDSINANYSPKVRGWIIYVTFQGMDNYGNFGKHIYQCAIDKSLSKLIVGIEVNN